MESQNRVQPTFLANPWLITDENDNAFYPYYPYGQPRTVVIPPVS